MKLFKKSCLILIVSAVVLLATSCATSISVDVTRPAELDLNGAKSISVLPFKPSPYYGHYDPYRGYRISILDFFFGFDRATPDERELLHHLQSEIEEGLYNSKYLKLISSTATRSAIENGTTIPADVYLTGEVIYFDVDDDKRQRRVKLPKKNEDDEQLYVMEDYWTRKVRMEFRYQIVDSSTNEIISFRTVNFSDSDTADHRRDLNSPYSMLRWEMNSTARKILKEIQPYEVTKDISLLSYKKHPGFEYADDLASDGLIEESYNKFYDIYMQEGIFEAGYNAAMLLEVQGRLDDAHDLMESLLDKGDSKQRKKAMNALSDIRNEIQQAEKLEKQNQDRLDK